MQQKRGGRKQVTKQIDNQPSVYMTSEQYSKMFDSKLFANSEAVMQAIENEDRENVIDMTEMAKSSKTTDMDNDRFSCILSEYSKK